MCLVFNLFLLLSFFLLPMSHLIILLSDCIFNFLSLCRLSLFGWAYYYVYIRTHHYLLNSFFHQPNTTVSNVTFIYSFIEIILNIFLHSIRVKSDSENNFYWAINYVLNKYEEKKYLLCIFCLSHILVCWDFFIISLFIEHSLSFWQNKSAANNKQFLSTSSERSWFSPAFLNNIFMLHFVLSR